MFPSNRYLSDNVQIDVDRSYKHLEISYLINPRNKGTYFYKQSLAYKKKIADLNNELAKSKPAEGLDDF